MSDSKSNLKFYCAWYCPFAQRAWISLIHKKADFEYIETNPYLKTPDFLALNPNGTIPVITDKGKIVYESPICVEYIDEAFPAANQILPSDPYKRAYARMWADFVTKKLCSPFYACLKNQEQEGQEKEKQKLLANLYVFTEAMDKEGPFFQGDSLGFIDIMYFPFAQRLFVLKFYRGFELPQDPRLERFRKWLHAVQEHPSVKPTVQDQERLIKVYRFYAEAIPMEKVNATLSNI